MLAAHESFPAVVVAGAWEMVAANEAAGLLTAGVAPHLLEPPVERPQGQPAARLPGRRGRRGGPSVPEGAIAVPLRVATAVCELALISTVATFGTAVEITASELSIESFLPADRATAEALRAAGPVL